MIVLILIRESNCPGISDYVIINQPSYITARRKELTTQEYDKLYNLIFGLFHLFVIHPAFILAMAHNHSLSTSSADFGDFNSAPASSAQTSALSQDDLLGSYDETIRYSPSLKSLPSPIAGASNSDLFFHDNNAEEHRRPGTSWPVQTLS